VVNRWKGQPPGHLGLPVRIVARTGDGIYRGRRPGGSECTVFVDNIGEPIPDDEAPVPGVSEPCLTCGDRRRTVTTWESDPDKPWLMVAVGTEPCPNCGAD
jgi:hypothetical protein